MTTFLARLKFLQNGMNTSEFARFLGVKQQTLDKYTKGRKPSVEFVVTVCAKCGKSSDWLLGLSDSQDDRQEPKQTAGIKQRVSDLKKSVQKVSDKSDELLKSISELEVTL